MGLLVFQIIIRLFLCKTDLQEYHVFQDITSIVQILLAQYSAVPVTGDVLYHSAVESTAILSTGCSR